MISIAVIISSFSSAPTDSPRITQPSTLKWTVSRGALPTSESEEKLSSYVVPKYALCNGSKDESETEVVFEKTKQNKTKQNKKQTNKKHPEQQRQLFMCYHHSQPKTGGGGGGGGTHGKAK